MKDIIYISNTIGSEGWLVYFISRPLVGTFCAASITPAASKGSKSSVEAVNIVDEHIDFPKKACRSFDDIIQQNPLAYRQLSSDMEQLLSNFIEMFEKPLPSLPQNMANPQSSQHRRPDSLGSELGHLSLMNSTTDLCEEEASLRQRLESVTNAAVELFRVADSHDLAQLPENTSVQKIDYEHSIEQHVISRLHVTLLFPRICAIREVEDRKLQEHIKQISNTDLCQVGIAVTLNIKSTLHMLAKVNKAIEMFRKIEKAHSPNDMSHVLLHTIKIVTNSESSYVNNTSPCLEKSSSAENGLEEPEVTVNADVLVSLMLIIIIRSSVKNLWARLIYMRYFDIMEDTESGEIGYALSTFEGVLAYIINDSSAMQWHSRRNGRLWKALKRGNIADLQALLEPDADEVNGLGDETSNKSFQRKDIKTNTILDQASEMSIADETGVSYGQSYSADGLQNNALAHVFPFQALTAYAKPISQPEKKVKRVSMDVMSTSSLSGKSIQSWTGTIKSAESFGLEESSAAYLAHIRTSKGESLLMLATTHKEDKKLEYLLSLNQHYSLDFVLHDVDNDGTSIMSAAVQTGQRAIVDIIIRHLQPLLCKMEFMKYLAIQDLQGRSAAHYLFHQPHLISNLGKYISWRLKDKNGQTPLFALCRSYDHEEYKRMVDIAITIAGETQPDGPPLNIDDHIDNKGNTLLHIVNDPQLTVRLLSTCNGDINASNNRKFTPLMVASRYGRLDMVRALFFDERIDTAMKDHRGLNAAELAKNDEIRNRIDELMLLSGHRGTVDRTTSIVRSIFVEDGSIRLLLKSAARNETQNMLVTTCHRSLQDFHNLIRWLAIEHPASWLPTISGFRSPFLIPSKPSRAVLHDIQTRLDKILKMLLQHATFSTHEMLWEFFLVPDISTAMLAERTRRKASARVESVGHELSPLLDISGVEDFVNYAKVDLLEMQQATEDTIRYANNVRFEYEYLLEASDLSSSALCTLTFLPSEFKTGLVRTLKALAHSESSPLSEFHYDVLTIATGLDGILSALDRPANMIGSMKACQKAIDRMSSSTRRSEKWHLAILDDARRKMQTEAAEKAAKSESELESLAKELRYTQQTIANELAGWQETRPKMMKQALKSFARKTVVTERARLQSLKRALRVIKLTEVQQLSE